MPCTPAAIGSSWATGSWVDTAWCDGSWADTACVAAPIGTSWASGSWLDTVWCFGTWEGSVTPPVSQAGGVVFPFRYVFREPISDDDEAFILALMETLLSE